MTTVAGLIVEQTNALRQQEGLAVLTEQRLLTAAAQGLADCMARTGQLSHQADGRTVAQRVEAQQYAWMFVAENIAYRTDVGETHEATARLLVDQWWNSPGHHQNMLATQPVHIGVATAVASDGSIYAVQVFAAPLPTDADKPK